MTLSTIQEKEHEQGKWDKDKGQHPVAVFGVVPQRKVWALGLFSEFADHAVPPRGRACSKHTALWAG